ncbi:MAG: hypothetical protein HY854_07625 [Burkholderiales bacterium]|nr:hypothetical protein [Burkholderiales bacterium]
MRKQLVLAFMVSLAAAAAGAQSMGGVQTTGSRLQLWLDSKFSYAGVDFASGCYFMNSHDAKGRALFISCPDGSSLKLLGKARVEGDRLCVEFPAPAGSECFTWHMMPDGRFQQRRDPIVTATGYILSVVPQ